MMDDATDMSTPVTRAELKAELEQLEPRLDQKLDEKLGLWGGALRAQIDASEQRLLTELARHVRAFQEAMSTLIAAVDDKYTDLPARVTQLESAVFRSKRR
jgi:hypothetical protein